MLLWVLLGLVAGAVLGGITAAVLHNRERVGLLEIRHSAGRALSDAESTAKEICVRMSLVICGAL